MEKLIRLLKSRKFWASVVALSVIVLKIYRPDIEVSEQQITDMITVFVAFIIGTALESKQT